MTSLTFRAEDHTYWLGEQRLPSVTEILDGLGFISPFSKNEERAHVGRLVHQMLALYEAGELDEDNLDPQLAVYLGRWKKMRHHAIPQHIEQPMYHADYGFAGTPDLVATTGKVILIVDFKTGGTTAWHGLQIGGYALLSGASQGILAYVGDPPRLINVDLAREKRTFLACVTVWRRKFT